MKKKIVETLRKVKECFLRNTEFDFECENTCCKNREICEILFEIYNEGIEAMESIIEGEFE